MQRNQTTTIGDLKSGDRFFLQKDKSKTVWEKVDRDIGKKAWAKTDSNQRPSPFAYKTPVVFIRRTATN